MLTQEQQYRRRQSLSPMRLDGPKLFDGLGAEFDVEAGTLGGVDFLETREGLGQLIKHGVLHGGKVCYKLLATGE